MSINFHMDIQSSFLGQNNKIMKIKQSSTYAELCLIFIYKILNRIISSSMEETVPEMFKVFESSSKTLEILNFAVGRFYRTIGQADVINFAVIMHSFR